MNESNTTSATTTIHPRTVQTYTQRQKLEALGILAHCNGNCRTASRITAIPWTTLRGWSHQFPVQYETACQKFNTIRPTSIYTDEAPDPSPLLADLKVKANLLVGALTPERIADAPLPQVARTLAVILPRIEALEKSTATQDFITARRDFQLQILYILRHHLAGQEVLQRIARDIMRLAGEVPEEEETDPLPSEEPETPTEAPNTTDERENAMSEVSERESPAGEISAEDTSDSPLPARDERPGEELGVRSPEPERESNLSEMSEREAQSTLAPLPHAAGERVSYIPAVNHDHSRIVGRDPESYPSRWA